MRDHHETPCEFIESRWRDYRSEPPRVGEVFAARKNKELYPHLFVVVKRGSGSDITYFNDRSTIIGAPYDLFTHWLPVAEAQIPET